MASRSNRNVGCEAKPTMSAMRPNRHCERSEAIQKLHQEALDCFGPDSSPMRRTEDQHVAPHSTIAMSVMSLESSLRAKRSKSRILASTLDCFGAKRRLANDGGSRNDGED
jgi:hypothetical protein